MAALDGRRETALVAAWIGVQGQPIIQDYLAGYLADWRWVTPTVDGKSLRELGLPPGSAYGRILDSLRAAWLDGSVRSAKEENQLLLRLVEEAKSGG